MQNTRMLGGTRYISKKITTHLHYGSTQDSINDSWKPSPDLDKFQQPRFNRHLSDSHERERSEIRLLLLHLSVSTRSPLLEQALTKMIEAEKTSAFLYSMMKLVLGEVPANRNDDKPKIPGQIPIPTPIALILTRSNSLAGQHFKSSNKFVAELNFVLKQHNSGSGTIGIELGSSFNSWSTRWNDVEANPPSIIVATYKQLDTLFQQGDIDLSRVKYMVMDEADHLMSGNQGHIANGEVNMLSWMRENDPDLIGIFVSARSVFPGLDLDRWWLPETNLLRISCGTDEQAPNKPIHIVTRFTTTSVTTTPGLHASIDAMSHGYQALAHLLKLIEGKGPESNIRSIICFCEYREDVELLHRMIVIGKIAEFPVEVYRHDNNSVQYKDRTGESYPLLVTAEEAAQHPNVFKLYLKSDTDAVHAIEKHMDRETRHDVTIIITTNCRNQFDENFMNKPVDAIIHVGVPHVTKKRSVERCLRIVKAQDSGTGRWDTSRVSVIIHLFNTDTDLWLAPYLAEKLRECGEPVPGYLEECCTHPEDFA